MRPKHPKSAIPQFYFEYLLLLLYFLFCFVFLAFENIFEMKRITYRKYIEKDVVCMLSQNKNILLPLKYIENINKNILNNFLIAASCSTHTLFFQKLLSLASAPKSGNTPVVHRALFVVVGLGVNLSPDIGSMNGFSRYKHSHPITHGNERGWQFLSISMNPLITHLNWISLNLTHLNIWVKWIKTHLVI